MAILAILAILAAASSSARAHADISTQNECDPQKKCNVCEACCKSYIADGNECDNCVTAACSTPSPTPTPPPSPAPAPGPVANITWSHDFPDIYPHGAKDAGTLKTALAPGATVTFATTNNTLGSIYIFSCSLSATTMQLQVHGVDQAGSQYPMTGQPTWQGKPCSSWSPDYGPAEGMSCCSNHLPPPPKRYRCWNKTCVATVVVPSSSLQSCQEVCH